jgi:RNA polymerase sigma-70 factor (ECF subfamily)
MRTEPPKVVHSLPEALAALQAQEVPLRAELARTIPARFRGCVSPDDVLQELRVGLLRAQVEAVQNWPAYLKAAVRNSLLRVLRRAQSQRRGGTLQARNLDPQTGFDGILSSVAESWGTPSRQLAGHEARQAIMVALTELPEAERIALCLCHFEGLSRKATAAEMGRTESAVNGLVYRALQRLRDLMGDPARFFSDVRRAPEDTP